MKAFFKGFAKQADLVEGGKADNLSLDIFNQKDLEEGMRVEREHTDSDELAREIASDHLAEDPEYYRKLRTIHKED